MPFVLLLSCQLQAQEKISYLDYQYKTTNAAPHFIAVTTKTDSGWQQLGYYSPDQVPAFSTLFKDEATTIQNGLRQEYYRDGSLKTIGTFINGKKSGTWMRFHSNGMISDSSVFINGIQRGARLGWNKDGYQIDSSYFDDNGNGILISWYAGGRVSMIGYKVQDSLKQGKWQYFNRDGKVRFEQVFHAGKLIQSACYDESGNLLEEGACEDKEADFKGGSTGWIKYLQKNLQPNVPVRMGAAPGSYKVLVLFVINTDGTVSDIEVQTRFGYGMEEEALRIIKKSPKWVPAQQYGRPVRAYRLQPITFVVPN